LRKKVRDVATSWTTPKTLIESDTFKKTGRISDGLGDDRHLNTAVLSDNPAVWLSNRNFHQAHVDGNGTNVVNDPTVRPDPTKLCFPNLDGSVSNLTTTRGQTVANAGALGFPNILGEIDRTWTTTNRFGGSVQVASSERVFDHGNNFTLGVSIDRGLVQFSSTSELGTVSANQFPTVQGFGLFIDQPSGDVAPVGLAQRRSIPACTRPTPST
jgi:hypothetical protein